MTLEIQAPENNVLRDLQLSWQQRGFKFHIDPPRELVPAFLSGYQPDAIAFGPDGRGIIVEVKRHHTQSIDRHLAELAKQVAGQKDWDFTVIYANAATELPTLIAKPSPEQVDAKLTQIQALVDAGHYGPAFITGWAILESLARMAGIDDASMGSRGFSPVQAIQILAEEGYLENDAAQDLRDMAKLRNAVVHGDLSIDVSASQVQRLIEQLRAILSNIQMVMSSPHAV